MRHWFVGIFLILLTSIAWAVLVGVPNLQHPTDQVYTSGQPTEDGFRQLSERGIKTVINVLPTNQCIAEEKDWVIDNKMKYRTVPFSLVTYRRSTVEQFAEVLKKAEKPVLIHCSTGNHVGGLWFAYRVLIQNASVVEALEEARNIGMKPYLEEPLRDWVRVEAKLQARLQ